MRKIFRAAAPSGWAVRVHPLTLCTVTSGDKFRVRHMYEGTPGHPGRCNRVGRSGGFKNGTRFTTGHSIPQARLGETSQRARLLLTREFVACMGTAAFELMLCPLAEHPIGNEEMEAAEAE